MNPLWPVLRSPLIQVRAGVVPLRANIAIVLVYQPSGCPKSLFDTLVTLRRAGYAPLAVVNGPLPAGDLTRLQAESWKILQRPNLGYDFGGYRDGIWHLAQLGVTPEALLVLNDTIWLPALRHGSTLERLAGLEADYAALSNFYYRPRRDRSGDLTGRVFASSFCFRVTRRVWNSEAFQRFWAETPMFERKVDVVEHGEVGFSCAMEAAGFPAVTLLDHDTIQQRFLDLPAEDKEAVVRRLPVLSIRMRRDLDELLDRPLSAAVRRSEIEGFLDRALPHLNPWDAMAVEGLAEGSMDFVKKGNITKPANARRFLDALSAAGVALNPQVHREIAASALAAE